MPIDQGIGFLEVGAKYLLEDVVNSLGVGAALLVLCNSGCLSNTIFLRCRTFLLSFLNVFVRLRLRFLFFLMDLFRFEDNHAIICGFWRA